MNSTADDPDANPGDGVALTAGGVTTLRAAIGEINALADPSNIINFNLPGAHTIQPASALPVIEQTTLVDGWSEPDFAGTPIVELDGSSAGAASGLVLTATNSEVRGLVINRFSAAGIVLDDPLFAQLQTSMHIHHNYIGTDVAGSVDLGNGSAGVLIRTIGNTISDNVISGNGDHGVWINQAGVSIDTISPNNVISNNNIGINAAGTAKLGNDGDGVLVDASSNNLVEQNVIGGNKNFGVRIAFFGGGGNRVESNWIGTDMTGLVDLGNDLDGAAVDDGGRDNEITGNTIAFNTQDGVSVVGGRGNIVQTNTIYSNVGDGVSVSQRDDSFLGKSGKNTITGNSIYGNGDLGIDLKEEFGSGGVTANDPLDADDLGGNFFQNFPVLSLAASNGSAIVVSGSLHSTPNQTYVIEFFANSTADASGHGEGKVYLGSSGVATDGSGDAQFTTALIAVVPVGQFVTATATDADRNTSEFSLARAVTASVSADIELQSATGSGAASVTVTYEVKLAAVGLLEIGFYRSADASFDGSDVLLDTVVLTDAADLSLGVHTKVIALGGGAGQLSLPAAGLPETTGDYFLLSVADHQGLWEDPAGGSFADNAAPLEGVYHVSGSLVMVHGTAGGDAISVSGGSVDVALNGQSYVYAGTDLIGVIARSHGGDDTYAFDHNGGFGNVIPLGFTYWGGSGNNTVDMTGSTGNDVGSLYYYFGFMYGSGFFVDVKAATQITIHGNGGYDWVYLYDAVGPDHLVGGEDHSYIEGVGPWNYTITAVEADIVYAQAINGGTNTADLSDTAGDDRFFGLPTYSYMSDAAFTKSVYAVGFGEVYGHFTAAGFDRADFYDSATNDYFLGRPDLSFMEGMGYHNEVDGADEVYAFATAGGTDDRADLFDSIGDDHFSGWMSLAVLDGPGYYLYGQGFDDVTAHSINGGTDTKSVFALDYVFNEVGIWL